MRRTTRLSLPLLLACLGCAGPSLHTHVEQDTWQPDAVRALAAGGADLNASDPEGHTPLWLAIRKGDPARVKLLLDLGADANGIPDAPGADPPLVYAADWERADLVKLLLDHGARPELRRPDPIVQKPNAFETAVKREELDIAVLVGLPAAQRAEAPAYEALMRAAFEGKPDEVKRRAAALTVRFDDFPAPSLLALLYAWPQEKPRPAQPAAALFEAGYRPTPGDIEWLGRHLDQVIAGGDAATFDALMDAAPTWTEDGQLPPSLVPSIVKTWVDDKDVRADAGWEAMLIRALGAGADPNAPSGTTTPLHLACSHRDVTPAATEALLRAGAKPDAPNADGDLPIHAALEAAYGDVEDPAVALCVAAHWAAGLDVDAANRNGDTPLMLAADKRRGEMVKLLLSYGADPTRTNAKGETAYFLALASPLHRSDSLAQDALAAVSTLTATEKATLDKRLKDRADYYRYVRWADAHREEIEAAKKRLADAKRLERETARARAAAEAAAKAKAEQAAAAQAERERRFRAPVEAPADAFRRSYRENLSPAGGCPGASSGCGGACCPPGCTCCTAAGYQRCLCPRGGLLIRGCPSGSKSVAF
ncbi:MAG: ankyrin repeat domain-containing protein [Myxococcales bacterium]|nr:ankyrin repeat domain-containing protein [Myxococcales bacterium]